MPARRRKHPHSDVAVNSVHMNSTGWIGRSISFAVSIAFHVALLVWLLSANLAGNEVELPSAPPIPIEMVKIPPPPPPPDAKNDTKPDSKPQPKRAAKAAAKPVDPGPPAHEISSRDDEWVAPRVNDNKSFVIGARRAPSDYAEKVKNQVIGNMQYPTDAYYKVPRNYKGDMKALQQQCMVAYEITVDKQGNMVSYKFDRCGNDKLDAAAEQALKRSGPFPPPPNQGAETYIIYGREIFRTK